MDLPPVIYLLMALTALLQAVPDDPLSEVIMESTGKGIDGEFITDTGLQGTDIRYLLTMKARLISE